MLIPSIGVVYPEQLNRDDFESRVSEWRYNNTIPGESREKAALKMLECYTHVENVELDLSRFGLSGLPSCICSLTHLRRLKISYNQLQKLPDRFCELTNLEALCLDSNCFTEVPVVISKLSNLRELDLANNRLQTVPDFLATLPNLQTLNLTRNQILLLPDQLGPFASLDTLLVRANFLSSWPDVTNHIQNLRFLDLSENPLTTLPIAAVTALPRDCNLYIQNNPLTDEVIDALARHMNTRGYSGPRVYLNPGTPQGAEAKIAVFAPTFAEPV